MGWPGPARGASKNSLRRASAIAAACHEQRRLWMLTPFSSDDFSAGDSDPLLLTYPCPTVIQPDEPGGPYFVWAFYNHTALIFMI
jgi:hypothetical protein